MSQLLKPLLRRSLLAALIAVLGGQACVVLAQDTQTSGDRERAFLAANDLAMTKMMDDMTIKPTGDISQDFVSMMTPHHQGAIDMAQAYLRYGQNEQLRRIAQEIIVDQQQEIQAMRLAVGLPLPAPAPVPTQPAAASTSTQSQSDSTELTGHVHAHAIK